MLAIEYLEVRRLLAAAPVVTAALKNDTGSSATDGITSNDTISGSVVDSLAITHLEAGFDTATPSQFVNVTSDLAANGTFTLSPSQLTQVAGGTLAEGSHVLHLEATDTAGHVSSIFNVSFTLATSAPKETAGLADDTGSSATDGITTVDTITGNVTDAVAIAHLKVGFDATTSAHFVDVTTALSANGTFTLSSAQLAAVAGGTLANGPHVLHVQATDIAGNFRTTNVTFTLDTTPPHLTAGLTDDTGSSSTDRITSNPAISGTVTDSLHVVSLLAGLDNAAPSSFVDVTHTVSNGTFSLNYSTLTQINGDMVLANGSHTLYLVAKDAAGNTSNAQVTFTLDTASPTITLGTATPIPSVVNTNITLLGKVSDPISGISSLEAATDSGVFVPVPVGQSGNFSFTTSLPLNGSADGSHTLTLIATNLAGNQVTSQGSFTLMSSSPTVAPLVDSSITDLAGNTWVLGGNADSAGNYAVYLKAANSTVFQQLIGRGVHLGVDPVNGSVWMIDSANNVYQWGTNDFPTPVPASVDPTTATVIFSVPGTTSDADIYCFTATGSFCTVTSSVTGWGDSDGLKTPLLLFSNGSVYAQYQNTFQPIATDAVQLLNGIDSAGNLATLYLTTDSNGDNNLSACEASGFNAAADIPYVNNILNGSDSSGNPYTYALTSDGQVSAFTLGKPGQVIDSFVRTITGTPSGTLSCYQSDGQTIVFQGATVINGGGQTISVNGLPVTPTPNPTPNITPTLIVLTHGAISNVGNISNQASDSDRGIQGWQTQMATTLTNTLEAAGSQTYTMMVDWAALGAIHPGGASDPSEYVAEAIKAFLDAQDQKWDVLLVGHSRGAIFNDEVIQEVQGNNAAHVGYVESILLDPTAAPTDGDVYPTQVPSNVNKEIVYQDGFNLFGPETRADIPIPGATNIDVSHTISNDVANNVTNTVWDTVNPIYYYEDGVGSHSALPDWYLDDSGQSSGGTEGYFADDVQNFIAQKSQTTIAPSSLYTSMNDIISVIAPGKTGQQADFGASFRDGTANGFITIPGLGGAQLTFGPNGLQASAAVVVPLPWVPVGLGAGLSVTNQGVAANFTASGPGAAQLVVGGNLGPNGSSLYVAVGPFDGGINVGSGHLTVTVGFGPYKQTLNVSKAVNQDVDGIKNATSEVVSIAKEGGGTISTTFKHGVVATVDTVDAAGNELKDTYELGVQVTKENWTAAGVYIDEKFNSGIAGLKTIRILPGFTPSTIDIASALRSLGGDTDQAASHALQVLGSSVTDIAGALQSVFNDAPGAVAAALNNLVFNDFAGRADAIGTALTTTFSHITDSAVAVALENLEGVVGTDIGNAVADVFGDTAQTLANDLAGILSPSDLATVLNTNKLYPALHGAATAIAGVLKGAGVVGTDIGNAIAGVFNIASAQTLANDLSGVLSASDLAKVFNTNSLYTSIATSANAIASVLKSAGYIGTDIGNAVASVLNIASAQTLANDLSSVLSASDLAKVFNTNTLYTSIATSANAIASVLKEAHFAGPAIGNAVATVLNIASPQALANDLASVLSASDLVTVFNTNTLYTSIATSANAIASVLKGAHFAGPAIGNAVATVLNIASPQTLANDLASVLSPTDLATVLNTNPLYPALNGAANAAASGIAGVLHGAGVAASQAGTAIVNIFDPGGFGLVDGPSTAELVTALATAYGISQAAAQGYVNAAL